MKKLICLLWGHKYFVRGLSNAISVVDHKPVRLQKCTCERCSKTIYEWSEIDYETAMNEVKEEGNSFILDWKDVNFRAQEA